MSWLNFVLCLQLGGTVVVGNYQFVYVKAGILCLHHGIWSYDSRTMRDLWGSLGHVAQCPGFEEIKKAHPNQAWE